MSASYVFSVSRDTANGRVVHDELSEEIAVALGTTPDDVLVSGDELTLLMPASVDQAQLFGVVTAHNPELHEIAYADRSEYRVVSEPEHSVIEFTQIAAPPCDYFKLRTFVIQHGSAGATLRLGVYSHSAREPRQLLAQGVAELDAASEGTLDVRFDYPLQLRRTTKLWLAFLCLCPGSRRPRFMSTEVLYGAFHGLRFQQADMLPGLASAVPNTRTAIYCALVG